MVPRATSDSLIAQSTTEKPWICGPPLKVDEHLPVSLPQGVKEAVLIYVHTSTYSGACRGCLNCMLRKRSRCSKSYVEHSIKMPKWYVHFQLKTPPPRFIHPQCDFCNTLLHSVQLRVPNPRFGCLFQIDQLKDPHRPAHHHRHQSLWAPCGFLVSSHNTILFIFPCPLWSPCELLVRPLWVPCRSLVSPLWAPTTAVLVSPLWAPTIQWPKHSHGKPLVASLWVLFIFLWLPCAPLVSPLWSPCEPLLGHLWAPCGLLVSSLSAPFIALSSHNTILFIFPCGSLVLPLWAPCGPLVSPLYVPWQYNSFHFPLWAPCAPLWAPCRSLVSPLWFL